MLINEKTGLSIAVVLTFIAASIFVASIHFMSVRNSEEIALLRQLYLDSASQDRTEMIRIESRLSVIEAKLQKVEEWCKKLIDEMNAREKRTK